jgi:hypothetical protein
VMKIFVLVEIIFVASRNEEPCSHEVIKLMGKKMCFFVFQLRESLIHKDLFR